MILTRQISFLVLLFAFATTAQAQGWRSIGDDPVYKPLLEICARAEKTTLPPPDPASKAAKDCDALALYDGDGRPADPKAARECALTKWTSKEHRDETLGTAGVLAMIYANGTGVPRNLDIAIAYACQADGAPAEMNARINHLVALKTKGPQTKAFDICDDIGSGYMVTFCSQRGGQTQKAKLDSRVAALTSALSPAGKSAFATLAKAKDAFISSLADNEVDQSGTMRGAQGIRARDQHNKTFIATLQAALAGRLPRYSAASAATADKALNAAYAKVMDLADPDMLGTVEKKGVKATQRLWLAYRDAFAAFVQRTPGARPPTTREQIVTALTKQRTKDLKALAP